MNSDYQESIGITIEPGTSIKTNSNRRMQILSILIVIAVALPLILLPEEGRVSLTRYSSR